jgi:hypothetical protein
MRTSLTLLIVCLSLFGCAAQTATPPPQASATADGGDQPGRCNTVLTGSRIPQCNRGDVQVITREELEQDPRWIHNPEPYGTPLPAKR